ncbi:hypothetical protein ACFQE1_03635 [Halobium palmae]|uniref:Uncharacterized protein n=1 Tax=Halobium palmae TaxID=1776492 RepID=A0ABD5RVQ7_9EURY
MSATTRQDEVEQHLRTAERHGYDAAASHYRDELAALEADESDEDDVDGERGTAALAEKDPKETALYAALTGQSPSPPRGSEDTDGEQVAALARQAEREGLGGAAEHYRRLAAERGVDVDDVDRDEELAALAELDDETAALAEQAEKIGLDGAAEYYRSR